jgi:hypothetical protein
MSNLPPDIQKHLPDGRAPVLAFLATSLPQITTRSTTGPLMQIEKYTSPLPPNSDNVEEMLALPIPPRDIVGALMHLVRNPNQQILKSVLCPHAPAAGGKRFQTYLVQYWVRILEIHAAQSKWQGAVDRLQLRLSREPQSELVKKAFHTLTYLPWSISLQGPELDGAIASDVLSAFFTTEWLSDEHEYLMLQLLKKDLQDEDQHNIFVENTTFFLMLTAAYNDRENYKSEGHYRWLWQRGEDLAAGRMSCLATIVNQNDNHWVALIIDYKKRLTLYGDPMESPISSNIWQVVDWWTGYHAHCSFTYRTLQVSSQSDSYSCGVLSWDSLRRHLLREGSGLPDECRMDDVRLQLFLRLTGSYKSTQVSTQSLEPPHHAASTIQPTKPGLKRPHDALIDDTQPAGQSKKLRESIPSSIRRALEKDGQPHGILLFFRKATAEEHRDWIVRTFQSDAEMFESLKWEKEREQQTLRKKKRRNATNRKQKQRARDKRREIIAGLRSPDGTKTKVSCLVIWMTKV